ncbi:MAG: HD-GYP domain-containing protein [Oscillospiraceae bacterium]|nr:HD-GYP domain-containing protein [Oscillospiraceae bacterium]
MKIKSSRTLKFLNIILPIIIVIGGTALFLQNYLYNTLERVRSFSEAERDGTAFVFDDITVDIVTRGGDSGSWESEDFPDENGIPLFQKAVGTIYEMLVINNSPDTIKDWTAVVYIPEDMYANNTWNGDFEFHQGVKSGKEAVQTLNLAEYSRYDITLDNRITSVGAMVPLYEGDYFVYYPNPDVYEMPISPKKEDSEKDSGARIGFIMYIDNRAIDYVADFSQGEIRYHLQTSIFKNPFFWLLGVIAVIWVSCLLAMIIVKVNLKRFIEQQKRDAKALEQTMQTFVNFIEAKDPSTMGHSLRVAQYSRMLAEEMGFSDDECQRIYYIALMHDCGKIYIHDEILTKPGKLTDQEYEIMKKHTVYGSEILRDFTAIDGMGTGALCHHERYDGKGYPNGIAGEDIPIIGRIICVSDAFDAMNSRRCYRSNLSEEVILNELKNNKGKQFDPHVIDCLMSLIESGAISMSGDGHTNT